MEPDDFRRYAAEFIGTFFLVFFAAGAAMVSAFAPAPAGAVIAGLGSGLVLMIVIWIFANISGGHVNPALSIALWLTGAFPARLIPGYVTAQLAGSAIGGLCLLSAFGRVPGMGANLPDIASGITPLQALEVEFLLSFAMMMVIVLSIAERGIPGKFFAVPIGAIVGLNVMLFGASHGASMNPARAFGPYLANGDWTFYWIYVLGPLAGLLLASIVCRYVFGLPQAPAPDADEQRQT